MVIKDKSRTLSLEGRPVLPIQVLGDTTYDRSDAMDKEIDQCTVAMLAVTWNAEERVCAEASKTFESKTHRRITLRCAKDVQRCFRRRTFRRACIAAVLCRALEVRKIKIDRVLRDCRIYPTIRVSRRQPPGLMFAIANVGRVGFRSGSLEFLCAFGAIRGEDSDKCELLR